MEVSVNSMEGSAGLMEGSVSFMEGSASMLAFSVGLLLAIGFIFLCLAIFMMITTWKLFEKAGEEGWKSIIPIYSQLVMIKIAFSNQKNWLMAGPFLMVVWSFLPSDNYVSSLIYVIAAGMSIYTSYGFIRRFTDTPLAVFSLFAPIIVYPIVAFSSKYEYTPYQKGGL